MKTTLLISAAILLSAATFAQTTVKNQETVKSVSTVQNEKGSSEIKSAGSASSATSIQSNAVKNTESNTYSAAAKGKNEISAEKKATVATAKTSEQQAKATASKDVTVYANAQSNVKIATSENNNKTQENGSLSNKASVFSTVIKNNGNQVKEEGKTAVNSSATLAVATSNQTKTNLNKAVFKTDKKINTTSAATLKTGSSATHAIKPAAASIKMSSHVKTNTGIRIK